MFFEFYWRLQKIYCTIKLKTTSHKVVVERKVERLMNRNTFNRVFSSNWQRYLGQNPTIPQLLLLSAMLPEVQDITIWHILLLKGHMTTIHEPTFPRS